MNAKIKNNPSGYITRSSLAGTDFRVCRPTSQQTSNSAEQEKRHALGAIDVRWYIQLPSKR